MPLFIHAPGLSKDGANTRQPVTLTDLYPTLCELAGLPVPKQCDGASLVPQLRKPQQHSGSVSLTSFQFWGDSSPSHAVSDERHRLISYPDGFIELYDLLEDPQEFTNLAKYPSFAMIKKRLHQKIPTKVKPIVGIPADSIYNQKRKIR